MRTVGGMLIVNVTNMAYIRIRHGQWSTVIMLMNDAWSSHSQHDNMSLCPRCRLDSSCIWRLGVSQKKHQFYFRIFHCTPSSYGDQTNTTRHFSLIIRTISMSRYLDAKAIVKLPSGKHLHNYGKLQCLMGKYQLFLWPALTRVRKLSTFPRG